MRRSNLRHVALKAQSLSRPASQPAALTEPSLNMYDFFFKYNVVYLKNFRSIQIEGTQIFLQINKHHRLPPAIGGTATRLLLFNGKGRVVIIEYPPTSDRI